MVGKLGILKDVSRNELGGKAYSLNRLIKNGVNVPDGIVICSSCFLKCLQSNGVYEEVTSCCQAISIETVSSLSNKLKTLVTDCEIDNHLVDSIHKKSTGLDEFVSVRSSATSEDSEQHTFAGLHDSFLNVRCGTKDLVNAIKKCWASIFNERALIYRLKKGIPIFEGMAVVIQNMVQAKFSGVVYTRHPIESELILVESSFGIGDSLVDGIIKPDSFLISRDTGLIFSKEIGSKKIKTELINENHTRRLNEVKDFSINDTVLNELVSVSLNIEKFFGKTQDIEWAYDKQLWFLQSRTVMF